jgi:hypothetical protein
MFRYINTQILIWLWRHSAMMLYRDHGNRFDLPSKDMTNSPIFFSTYLKYCTVITSYMLPFRRLSRLALLLLISEIQNLFPQPEN